MGVSFLVSDYSLWPVYPAHGLGQADAPRDGSCRRVRALEHLLHALEFPDPMTTRARRDVVERISWSVRVER